MRRGPESVDRFEGIPAEDKTKITDNAVRLYGFPIGRPAKRPSN